DASIRNPVRGFRDRVLGGRVLTDEEARAFVTSPAVRLLSSAEFGEGGIPPAHRAHLVADGMSPQGERVVTVWVVAARFKREFARPLVAQTVWRIGVGGETVEAWPGSPLYELAELGRQLSEYYPWEMDDATQFVLTGKVPEALPLRAHLRII